MRRILIVGNSGAGKSRLARLLGERLRLPVIHLDVLFWKPGWVESERDDFRVRVAEALAGDAWICDGNFSGSWDLRMPRADTIVWLAPPRLVCLWRAVTRRFRYSKRRRRPDMAQGCDETIDLAFYRFIWTYDSDVAPKLQAALDTYGRHARLVRLASDRDVSGFLESLPQA